MEGEAEKFSLRTLHDTDAFIADMVFYVYSDDLHLIHTVESLEELKEQSRGKSSHTSSVKVKNYRR